MTEQSHRLTRDQIIYSFSPKHPPVLRIAPGDRVVLETHDARTGTIQCDDDLLDHPHPLGANPATGPIEIEGAEPGDSLCVEILNIDLAPSGFLAVKAGKGLLSHLADDFATRIVPVRDGVAVFDSRFRIPLRPMVGVIGTSPAESEIENLFPGPHGGNMDNRYAGAGARVYLPVEVAGALFALGDVHAAMGDGEITYIGLEIAAEVTVKIDLLKGRGLSRPRIETPTHWVTTGDDVDLGIAARIAAEEMVLLMQERAGLSFADAYMLMSAAVDVQICQCCEPGGFPTTTRAVVSKELIP